MIKPLIKLKKLQFSIKKSMYVFFCYSRSSSSSSKYTVPVYAYPFYYSYLNLSIKKLKGKYCKSIINNNV